MENVEQEGLNFNKFKFPKDKFLAAAIGLLLFGFFLTAYGAGMFLWSGSAGSDDIKIIEGSLPSETGELIVDISGAVNKPGVHKLTSGSRVNDAIIAAGGLTNDADAKRINLAAKVSDGQKIHIPSVNDPVSSASQSRVSGVNDTGSSYGESGLINVNSATEAELDKLPGVGPVTAGKIINGRPYSSVEELLSRKVVNSSTFEKIKGLVSY